MRALLVYALLSATACSHRLKEQARIADTAAAPLTMGPRIVSRPPSVDAPEYYVELKPEFDQVKYSAIIASRVRGKVGYIYQNFHGFTIHTIPDSTAAKIRGMPEVMSVVKSTLFHLD
jgi:hypothetical protein